MDLKMEYESDDLTLFPEGSDADTKREFAKALVKALTDLKVAPGDKFVVMSEREFERLSDDIEHMDNQFDQMEADLEDARSAEDLVELIEDMDRGIIDRDELIEHARRGSFAFNGL